MVEEFSICNSEPKLEALTSTNKMLKALWYIIKHVIVFSFQKKLPIPMFFRIFIFVPEQYVATVRNLRCGV